MVLEGCKQNKKKVEKKREISNFRQREAVEVEKAFANGVSDYDYLVGCGAGGERWTALG